MRLSAAAARWSVFSRTASASSPVRASATTRFAAR